MISVPDPAGRIPMRLRILLLGLSVGVGVSTGQTTPDGESAPLREEAALTGGTPVQQVLAVVDPEAANSLAGLQAAALEKCLADLAGEIVSR